MNQFAPSATSGGFTVARAGVYLYGLATLAAGVLDLIWGEFEGAHQPIQALGAIVIFAASISIRHRAGEIAQ